MSIRRVQLGCGLPLIVERMGGVRSAALTWLIPAGASCEANDRRGLASMWSELICRGAGDLDSRAHADALDRLGVNRSSSPGGLFLSVGASLVGSRLTDALPLIVDMVTRPRFDEQSIGPSRELAIQAIKSLEDDPYERAVIAARERHLPDPLGRSTYGDIAGLTAITRADITGGWASRARPEGSILAIAGDVAVEEIVPVLDELLEGWAGRADEPAQGATPARGRHHVEDDTNQVQIVLVHDAPREEDTDSMLERVITYVLSGGMSGRLFTEVRERRGLCYAVSAAYRSSRDFGVSTAYVGTTPDRASTSLEVLQAELERINTPEGQVTEEEFQRAIIGLKAGLVLSGESTAARASALASDVHKLGRPRSLDEVAERIDAITLDEVNGYAAKRTLGETTVVTLGPQAV